MECKRQRRAPVSEECRYTINRLAAYLLHSSDVYLSMACYYVVEEEMTLFVEFFEEEAELKRQQAKHFLRFLRKRDSMMGLPIITRKDSFNWGGATQGMTVALHVETTLQGILEDLKEAISEAHETELINYVIELLEKQKRNIDQLDHLITYYSLKEKKPMESEPEMSPGASASGGFNF